MEHYLHLLLVVSYIWNLQMLWTLILSCSHLEGSWQKEVLLDPSGQSMEQILGKQRMNCSKDSRKWVTIKSRTSSKKMEQIGLTGNVIHQQHHIWVVFGSVKSEARNILEGLLRTHSLSLNDQFLRSLMTEVELIVNSRPLTVETRNDANIPTTISPSNFLTLKSNLVMPPPGEFSRQDLYSKKR